MNATIMKTLLFIAALGPLLIAPLPFPPPPASAVTGGELNVLDEETFAEAGTTRTWRLVRSRRMKSPEQVEQYLADLNSGNGSSAIWRLPSRDELYRLFSKFDLKNNGDVQVALEGNYWHTDEKGMLTVGAWEIGDQCGPERFFYPAQSGYVWAVASGKPLLR